MQLRAVLRRAEMARLLGHDELAEDDYRAVLREAPKPQRPDKPESWVQQARLWLGDLLLDTDPEQAKRVWVESPEHNSPYGSAMHQLAEGKEIRMPGRSSNPLANDIEYLNARLALMRNDLARYRSELARLSQSSSMEWPTPLAHVLLARMSEE